MLGFLYAQTGSGKTYTMAGTQSNPGVNIRALQELFEIAQQRSGENDTRLKCARSPLSCSSNPGSPQHRAGSCIPDVPSSLDALFYLPPPEPLCACV
jgi:hypothetical protein